MKCHDFENQLQDWLDGDLHPAQADRLRAHAEACPACAELARDYRALRRDLADLPAPELSPEQAQRLLAGARPRRRAWPAAATTAAAAMVLAAVFLPFADWKRVGPAAVTTETADITISLHQPRTVRLALASQRRLENATLELELPPGVTLQGRPDQRVLRWQTDIAAGENRLSLPLVAHEAGIQELVARIEHEGKSREVRLRLNAREADDAPPPRGGLESGRQRA